MSPLDQPWENISFSFRFPKVYFYLHGDCSYCSRFSPQVPFVSIRLQDALLSY